MEPMQLADGVYDVGVIDWNVRDFHGYSTDLGTTYNSFLIADEKTVLIDTVRKEFSDELIDNIAAVMDPKKIDYVISNHTELDHSGGLARVMHRIGEDKPVYASKMGHKNLPKHFRQNLNIQPSRHGPSFRCCATWYRIPPLLFSEVPVDTSERKHPQFWPAPCAKLHRDPGISC